MAKGQASKNVIEEKLLEIFDGAFKYDKEIRIPMVEDGNDIQIKITMTCAKTNVEPGEDTALPGATKASTKVDTSVPSFPIVSEKIEASEDEKAATMALMAELGL